MKKLLNVLLSMIMMTTLTACSSTPTNNNDLITEKIQIKQPTDKYTAYIDYFVGKNCATIGYESLGGDRNVYIGENFMKIIFVTEDGHYIGISDETIKDYVVVDQSLEANTEVKFTFEKDDEGNEYSWTNWQSVDEIILKVKKVGSSETTTKKTMTAITPSPDKYTCYVKDYVGRNLANCGYISMGGDLRDTYGATNIKLNIITDDGSYVGLDKENILENYVVTDQNLEPNTIITMTFEKDDNGNEYDWTDFISCKEIDLYVTSIQE